ncbi:MAG: hypothetical protein R6U98_22425 [Pirellulaceae bacterium]
MESGPTQAVLPLVGLAAEKVIRDRYKVLRHPRTALRMKPENEHAADIPRGPAAYPLPPSIRSVGRSPTSPPWSLWSRVQPGQGTRHNRIQGCGLKFFLAPPRRSRSASGATRWAPLSPGGRATPVFAPCCHSPCTLGAGVLDAFPKIKGRKKGQPRGLSGPTHG